MKKTIFFTNLATILALSLLFFLAYSLGYINFGCSKELFECKEKKVEIKNEFENDETYKLLQRTNELKGDIGFYKNISAIFHQNLFRI